MPNKSKSRNNSRNNSRKSTASTQSTTSASVDDDFGSILAKLKPVTSSKKTTPKAASPRPEFLEPLSPTPPVGPPPPSPWDLLGMTESEYTAMQARVHKRMMEDQRETYINNILAELKTPAYWSRRIDRLETEREYFNKKRGWSAMDVACVEQIDAEIKECQDEIDALYDEQDRLEYERD